MAKEKYTPRKRNVGYPTSTAATTPAKVPKGMPSQGDSCH